MDFIRTFRLDQILVVFSVLIFGVFASSHTANSTDYLALALLSISGHIFGYGLNERSDRSFDLLNPKHRKRRVRIRNPFSRKLLLTIALLQLSVMIFVGYLTYGLNESAIFAGLALLSISIYNLFGKISGSWVLIPHFFFALGFVFLCIAGFTLFDSFFDISLCFGLLLAALFFNSALANSTHGGLHDLKSDFEAGIWSVVILTGSSAAGKTVNISPLTRSSGYFLYLINIPLVLAQGYLNGISTWNYPVILALFFFGFVHLWKLLRMTGNRELMRYDVTGSSAFIFFANSIAWIHCLPSAWWLFIAFHLTYPFIRNHPNVFGRWTLVEFVRSATRRDK